MDLRWILIGLCIVGAALLVLIVAAVLASRSRKAPPPTPTQQAENPYRKIYPPNED